MKGISILGSTGSIGTQALSVVRHHREKFRVVALAAQTNHPLLLEQINEFSPEFVALFDETQAKRLRALVSIPVLSGAEGVGAVASASSAELVIAAVAGTQGLAPTFAAIEAGKDVALANKEALVSGGELLMKRVREKGVALLPVDSEHSALFQCLQGEDRASVARLVLTASGGPFRNYTDEQLRNVRCSEALSHPNWSMGPKITVDCSTLMNKGLEVIEAYWLFNLPLDKIDVVIHPESIIHSFVEFVDGSIKAQLSEPTMSIPIQYAMTYPERMPTKRSPFPFANPFQLTFTPPDRARFRCLPLAYEAQKKGQSYPAFMNGANEELVQRLRNNEIRWIDLGPKLETLVDRHRPHPVSSLEEILGADAEGRRAARQA